MNRQYRFDMDISGVTENITFEVAQHSLAGSLGLTTLDFHCKPYTPSVAADIDITKILEYFNNTSVSLVAGANQAVDVPPFGAVAVPTYGERFVMERREILDERGFPLWKHDDGRRQVMLSGVGETLQFDDLPDVAGETYKLVPLIGERTAIHDNGTGDVVLRVPNASSCVPVQGKDIEFEAHKTGTAGTFEVTDKDGNNIITLIPGEHIPLRVTWLEDGTTEIRSIGEITRTLEIVGTSAGNMGDNNYFTDTEGAGRFMRPFSLPPVANRSVDRFHADSFALGGAATWSSGDALTNIDIPEAYNLLKAGRARIEFEAVLAPGGSGSMTAGNGLVFTVNAARQGPIFYYDGYDANAGSQIYNASLVFDVDVDDRLLPLFRYNQTGLTMAVNQINLDYYRMRIDLSRLIVVTQ